MKASLKGFTLIELSVVLVLISIIALVAAPMLYKSVMATETGYLLSDQSGQGNQASIQIARDLQGLYDVSTLSLSANSITFTDLNNSSISYALSNSNLTRNGVLLAQHVTSLVFSYYDATGSVTNTASLVRYIAFSFMISQQNIHQTFSQIVYLRNA